MCRTIPVFRLSFRPDRSVINYILKNKELPEESYERKN